MNCDENSAKMGWRLFSAADPAPTREEINRALTASDLGPVSARMYKHYGALRRHGFGDYMPINELDVRVKLARYRDAS